MKEFKYENEGVKEIYEKGIEKIANLSSEELFGWIKTMFLYKYEPYFKEQLSGRPSTSFEILIQTINQSNLNNSEKKTLLFKLDKKIHSFYEEYLKEQKPNDYTLRELKLTLQKVYRDKISL